MPGVHPEGDRGVRAGIGQGTYGILGVSVKGCNQRDLLGLLLTQGKWWVATMVGFDEDLAGIRPSPAVIVFLAQCPLFPPLFLGAGW